jgi:hypothetical protein
MQMESKSQELLELKKYLQQELEAGNKYVALNSTWATLHVTEFCCFEKPYDAWEYCYENTTDYDIYGYRSIQTCLQALDYGLEKTFNRIDLQNNPDANPLYGRDGNAFTDLLVEYWEEQQSQTIKTKNMNAQNYEYLKDNMKYMGFGEDMSEALQAHLKEGKLEFSLSNKTEVNKKPFEVNLHFRKSDNSDMYFFNSYNASLQRSNGEKVDQTFYLTKGKGITAKEAYNMLEGRAVFKELNTKDGQAYKAWVQLDFENKDKHNNHVVKQFHENFGYDLKAAASKFSIAELADPEKEKALMKSLQKGNIQSVSVERDGNVSKMFIEANPQFKTVNLYDAKMKRVQKEELNQYHAIKQTLGKEVKPEQKEDLKQDKKKEVKQKTGNDLAGQAKKTSRKKGMSV